MSSELPPRAKLGMRDMVMSVLVLVAIIGGTLALLRGCSFQTGPPESDPANAPTADLRADLGVAARSVDFPLRLPAMPAQWKANSSSTSPVEPTSVVIRAGWITPAGRYVQVAQSGAPAADVVRVVTDREGTSTGQIDVAGATWAVYQGRRDERVWVTALDGATVLITGSGSEDDFRAAATAVTAATPLPKT